MTMLVIRVCWMFKLGEVVPLLVGGALDEVGVVLAEERDRADRRPEALEQSCAAALPIDAGKDFTTNVARSHQCWSRKPRSLPETAVTPTLERAGRRSIR